MGNYTDWVESLEKAIVRYEDDVYKTMDEFEKNLRSQATGFNNVGADFSFKKDEHDVDVFQNGMYTLECKGKVSFYCGVEREQKQVAFKQLYGKNHNKLADTRHLDKIHILDQGYYVIDRMKYSSSDEMRFLYNPEGKELAKGQGCKFEVLDNVGVIVRFGREQELYDMNKNKIVTINNPEKYRIRALGEMGIKILDRSRKEWREYTEEETRDRYYDTKEKKIISADKIEPHIRQSNISFVGDKFYAIASTYDSGRKIDEPINSSSEIHNLETGEFAKVDFVAEKVERLEGNKLRVDGCELRRYIAGQYVYPEYGYSYFKKEVKHDKRSKSVDVELTKKNDSKKKR